MVVLWKIRTSDKVPFLLLIQLYRYVRIIERPSEWFVDKILWIPVFHETFFHNIYLQVIFAPNLANMERRKLFCGCGGWGEGGLINNIGRRGWSTTKN